ncbi:MAG TPA: GNAT family N-acetyltransferase [Pseudolysinimonas sp.]|nr:GNAT family N-acetyltransferase [Pseudolysinimonas sp.]
MSPFTIARLTVPDSLSAPGGAEFAATVEVRNASEIRAYGTPEIGVDPAETLSEWHDPQAPHALWAAWCDGRIVGRGVHEWATADPEIGWVDVDVHPDFEGRGIGTALTDAVEDFAVTLGQKRLVSYAVSPYAASSAKLAGGPELAVSGRPAASELPTVSGPPAVSGRPAASELPTVRSTPPFLVPPTGAGSISATGREARFLLARGYRLEQVTRASRYALPPDHDELMRLYALAETAAGPDYRVHTWRGLSPHNWLDDLGILRTRMSTDAPTAGLEEPEDVWDAARIADTERREALTTRVTLTAVVEYLPSGRLAGGTWLTVPADLSRAVSQDDTLVLREHRGRRLGMLLKVANLLWLTEIAPGHPSVITWNAEENRPMLSVNEAIGFVGIGSEGAWRRDLVPQ